MYIYAQTCSEGELIVIHILYFRESAKQVDPKVERGLFLFAVSNSCVNPIVYGKPNIVHFTIYCVNICSFVCDQIRVILSQNSGWMYTIF